MSEYITKESLMKKIKDVKQSVYSSNSDYMTGYLSAISGIENVVADLPTVDVVPVVRCKNCKHYRDSTQAKGIKKCAYSSTNETDFLVMPDDFCNYGEKEV